MDSTNQSTLNSTTPIGNWVEGPNTRGTIDIILTCSQTVVLCAWVSVCVNIPSPKRRTLDITRDKFYFLLLTLLGPELVFMLACLQYLSARRSSKEFAASIERQNFAGTTPWTVTHGFYADMGGICVKPLETYWDAFPVNSKELLYLVEHGYMDYPDISLEDIKARGKVDGLGKAVTVVQALYFTVSTLARPFSNLTITTLELTVLGFILCTLCTYIVWWHKPVDVELRHTFQLKATIQQIHTEADKEAFTWPCHRTPLDFISCDPWSGANLWQYYVNILHSMGLPRQPSKFPADRVESLNWPKPPNKRAACGVYALAMVYSATFFAAWNWHFPTAVERILWRATAITQMALIAAAGAIEISYLSDPYAHPIDSAEKPLPPLVNQSDIFTTRAVSNQSKPENLCLRLSRYWSRPRNNDPHRHPSLNVPLRSLLTTTPICAAYCVCRWYLLVEDLIAFRSVDPSAYVTVDWTQYVPSFS